MASHIHSQESVIQGLRSERKCWSEELAQQSIFIGLFVLEQKNPFFFVLSVVCYHMKVSGT